MLHDMFDLLGLPMFNTGLAIYSIWYDDTKENDDVEEDPDTLQKKQSVLTAAGRWRKKQKKLSALSNSRANSASKSRTRATSAKFFGGRLPKLQKKNKNVVSPVLINMPKEKVNSAEPILIRGVSQL